jgi:phosphate uptake regulator
MDTRNDDPIERKVQLAGGSTFTLSIPREWGVAQDIQKGETVYLYRQHDRLIVAPSKVRGDGRGVHVDLAETDGDLKSLRQRLRAAYTAGYDRITVLPDGEFESETRRAVHRTVNTFIGMNIHEEEDVLVVQDHLDAGAVSPEQSLVQMRQLALGMQRDAVEAVRMNDEMLARHVRERDDHVDRLFAFISRGLHRGLEDVNELDRLNVTRRTAFHYYKMARELERIADRAERVAEVAGRQSTRPDERLGRALRDAVVGAVDVVELALSDGSGEAVDAYGEVAEAVEALDYELSGRAEPDAYLYGRVVESARRTAQRGLNVVNASIEISVDDLLYADGDGEGVLDADSA